MAEIMLPFADFPRDALHLGFEDLIGDPAQEFQGGDHCLLPVAEFPINHLHNLQLARRG
jgi:hypothetical protein